MFYVSSRMKTAVTRLVLLLTGLALSHRIDALFDGEEEEDEDIFQSCMMVNDKDGNVKKMFPLGPWPGNLMPGLAESKQPHHGAQRGSLATGAHKANLLKNIMLISSRKKDPFWNPRSARNTMFIGRKKRSSGELLEENMEKGIGNINPLSKRFLAYFKFDDDTPRIPLWKLKQRYRNGRRIRPKRESERSGLEDALPYLGAYVQNMGSFLAGDRDLTATVNQLRCMERKLEEKRHSRTKRRVQVQQNKVTEEKGD